MTKYIKKLILSFMILFIFLFNSFPVLAAKKNIYTYKTKNVLILHSYSSDLKWTNDITEGISSILKKDSKLHIYLDYMDLKHFSTENYINNFFNMQKSKYNNLTFDLIICCDNGSLDYINKYGDILFPNIPVVFCGINTLQHPSFNSSRIYAGIDESLCIEENFNLISTIQPNITNLILIDNPHSIYTKIDSDDFFKICKKYKSKFSISFYESLTLNDLNDLLNKIPKNSALIFLTDPIMISPDNYRYLYEFKKNIFANYQIPIYSFWDFELGHGIIGGKLTSGFEQGREAANLAVKILKGEKFNSKLYVKENNPKFMFDYAELKKFNIDFNQLPKNSIIINSPIYLLEKNKYLIIILSLIFVVLIISILFLILYANRKKTSEEKIRISEERYRLAVEGSNDIIWEWDIKNNKIFISDKWKEVSGYDFYENYTLPELVDYFIFPFDKKHFMNNLNNCLKGDSTQYYNDFRILTKTKSIKWFLVKGKLLKDEQGNPLKLAGSLTDITEKKVKEIQIQKMAFYDSLTNLPNRTLFTKHLRKRIDASVKKGYRGALLFLDLDNFKQINDTLGHYEGDKTLKKIAKKLQKISSKYNCFPGRLGGDEFLLLIPEIEELIFIETICNNILESFNSPLYLNDSSIYTTCSIGVVTFPDHGTDEETLFKKADIAMYNSKQKGKNKFSLFNNEMNNKVLRNAKIELELRKALLNNEFTMYYQPEINLKTKKIQGMEALIRWENKNLGWISPSEFIPIAEETALIIPLGNWILNEVLKQNKEWKAKGYNYDFIALNISGIQLMQENFLNKIKYALEENNINPKYLQIEITETSLIELISVNIEKLYKLKDLGITLALDDFGTGYSSLNYLNKFPITTLKIDSSFINNIETNFKDKVIIESIITLSHKFNYTVTAEGIENKNQMDILSNLGCDIGQGYYFSKPTPVHKMENLLKNN